MSQNMIDAIMGYEHALHSLAYAEPGDGRESQKLLESLGKELAGMCSLSEDTAIGLVKHNINRLLGWWQLDYASPERKKTSVQFSDIAQELVQEIHEEESTDPVERQKMIADTLAKMRT